MFSPAVGTRVRVANVTRSAARAQDCGVGGGGVGVGVARTILHSRRPPGQRWPLHRALSVGTTLARIDRVESHSSGQRQSKRTDGDSLRGERLQPFGGRARVSTIVAGNRVVSRHLAVIEQPAIYGDSIGKAQGGKGRKEAGSLTRPFQ